VDKDFFEKEKAVKAKTLGNARVSNQDFQRVAIFPYQEGYDEHKKGSKKQHKKQPRKKVHVNWTAQE
jgi:hypothetical protein